MVDEERHAGLTFGGWRKAPRVGTHTRRVAGASIALAAVSVIGLVGPAMAANPLKHHYTVALTGANQVPPAATSGSGTAVVKVDGKKMTVCVKIKVTNIPLPATGAHIHQGLAGMNGPIVIQLTPPTAKKPTSTKGSSHFCATGVDPSLISGLLNNPMDFYVNVHTTNFPSGAIRGQLA